MGQINGATTYLSAHFAYYIVWSEDQVNATNNTSRVSASVYVQKIGSYSVQSVNNAHSLWIDGTEFTANNSVDMNPETTPQLLVSGSKTITHNADGSKAINISASGYICKIEPRPSYTPYSGSGSGTATLTTISRASAVSTTSASSVTSSSAVVGGNVTDTGIPANTDRGIYWGTSSSNLPNKISYGGSGGAYSWTWSGLAPGTTYYYKAYSYNSSYGYSYGIERSFTTSAVAPTITTQNASNIGTTTATANGNITATGGANPTRRGFCYIEGATGTPTILDLTAYDDGSFGTGAFTKALTGLKAGTNHRVRAFTTNSVGTSYGAVVDLLTLGTLVQSERNIYLKGIQTTSAERGLYLTGGLGANAERSIYLHGCIREFSDLNLWIEAQEKQFADMSIYVDGVADGFNLYNNLRIGLDNSAVRNRVYVRGGTYLSDEVSISQVADGEQTIFYLPEKPHEIRVYEGVAEKTVGIKNIDSFDDYDYLMNYQEKYIEIDVAPTVDTVITVSYKYDIPVLVAVEDNDSIEKYGQFEYVIFDKNINTIQQARDRASAELLDYAESITNGTFNTLETGFKAGQYIMINIPDIGVDGKFVVKSVKASSMGGGKFNYTISVVSAELLGIIRFLVDLLESNKNALDIATDEVVDEITTVTGDAFALTDGTPTLTTHTGAYKYDSDADWNVAQWEN